MGTHHRLRRRPVTLLGDAPRDWFCPKCGERLDQSADCPCGYLWDEAARRANGDAPRLAAVTLTPYEAARVLADESWKGRWRPEEHLNTLPLAQHTMSVLYAAGYALVAHDDATPGRPS